MSRLLWQKALKMEKATLTKSEQRFNEESQVKANKIKKLRLNSWGQTAGRIYSNYFWERQID